MPARRHQRSARGAAACWFATGLLGITLVDIATIFNNIKDVMVEVMSQAPPEWPLSPSTDNEAPMRRGFYCPNYEKALSRKGLLTPLS